MLDFLTEYSVALLLFIMGISLALSSLIWDNWDNPVLSYLLQGEPGSPGTPGLDGEQVSFA